MERFEMYGLPQREGRCPHCGGKGRHRLVGAFFLGSIRSRLASGGEVLEVGPSKVTTRRLVDSRFLGGARYTAIDIRKLKHHELLPAPHRFIEMSATSLGFADGSFDVVVCNHVLPYVPDADAAVRELRRCMKPNGVALLNVHRMPGPTRSARELREERPDVYTDAYLGENGTEWYFGSDYEAMLEVAGFSVRIVDAGALVPQSLREASGIKRLEELVLGFASREEAESFEIRCDFPEAYPGA